MMNDRKFPTVYLQVYMHMQHNYEKLTNALENFYYHVAQVSVAYIASAAPEPRFSLFPSKYSQWIQQQANGVPPEKNKKLAVILVNYLEEFFTCAWASLRIDRGGVVGAGGGLR